jgi:membrane fusion protein (multidrug efflux system)
MGTVLVRESLKTAILIPQRATFEALDRRYVYVVGKDNVAHKREVTIQHELDGAFVVKGLGADDKIVVEGVRQVRDGGKVVYDYRRPDDAPAK